MLSGSTAALRGVKSGPRHTAGRKRPLSSSFLSSQARDSSGAYQRVCGPSVESAESCMDVLPDVPCWSRGHYLHIIAVMSLLVPYYIVSLIMRSNIDMKSSAVIVDGPSKPNQTASQSLRRPLLTPWGTALRLYRGTTRS